MFEIGFSELLLVMILGLLILGPKRLPLAVKTVTRWIQRLRCLVESAQNDLSKQFRVEEHELNAFKGRAKTKSTTLSPEEIHLEQKIKKNPPNFSDTACPVPSHKRRINSKRLRDPKNK